MEVLLFGGTWEGRTLAQRLAAMGISVTYSVATDYGREVTESAPGLTIQTGRLDEAAMVALMQTRPFSSVVDATHPYATEVSRNIRSAAQQQKLPYHRLLRASQKAEGSEKVLFASSAEDAARLLAGTEGAILLTTGSKELSSFTTLPDYQQRLWVRVLPSLDSLSAALNLGVPAKHIICMQGPFTQELNTALLHQIGCTYLVTKDSGKAGGFAQKVAAAQQAGARLLVIARPTQEEGRSLEELLQFFQSQEATR